MVQQYKLYHLDHRGMIKNAEWIDAVDDDAALAQARERFVWAVKL